MTNKLTWEENSQEKKKLKSTKQTEKMHHKYLENTNVALKEESDVEEP